MVKTNDASIPKVARRGRKRKVTVSLITLLELLDVMILDIIFFNETLCVSLSA